MRELPPSSPWKIEELIAKTRIISITGRPAGFVTEISSDSRTTETGDLFVSLAKNVEEATKHAKEAALRGACAVVSEMELSELIIPLIRVSSVRETIADIASIFYGNPSLSLSMAGVTGTNGKTTTSWIIRHLCNTVGRPSGLIGTLEYILPGIVKDAPRTTPESLELHGLLAQMRDGGFRAAAMEVSSHALVQNRIRNLEFDVAVFTNLTLDHLDFHHSMEEYFEAKASLFTRLGEQKEKKGRAIINADDRYGHRLIDRLARVPVFTYGQGSNCHFRASNIKYTAEGSTFCLDAKGRSYLVRTPLIGLFNIYNTLAAIAACSSMGLELRRIVAAAATIPQVPGRLESVPGRRNFQVYVDYAHTPDALENVLKTIRQLEPARVVTVFGCGGDRDRSKRPLMAAIAEGLSDKVIVTSDNPRHEDPMNILREVEKGFSGSSHETFVDRESAIKRAVELAGPRDIVLIAGKGHEKFQETALGRQPFSDVAIAARAMATKPLAGTSK